MTKTILHEISQILLALAPEKPWLTAAGLSRRIKRLTGTELAPSEIEYGLIEHAQSPRRAIRYSHYPSKKTLDILWGHVDVVGEKRKLAELERMDDPEYTQCKGVSDNAPWFFLSHNYRDFADALKLQDLISKHKYGTWLFETEIPQGGLITPLAQAAIKQCEFFLSYVTRRSIGSLWVHKEIEVARRDNDCKTYVVVDGRDEDLLRIFENWTGEWSPKREMTQKFCSAAVLELAQYADSVWVSRCEAFVNSLHEYVDQTNLLLCYPELSEATRWHGKRLRIKPIEEFLASIA